MCVCRFLALQDSEWCAIQYRSDIDTGVHRVAHQNFIHRYRHRTSSNNDITYTQSSNSWLSWWGWRCDVCTHTRHTCWKAIYFDEIQSFRPQPHGKNNNKIYDDIFRVREFIIIIWDRAKRARARSRLGDSTEWKRKIKTIINNVSRGWCRLSEIQDYGRTVTIRHNLLLDTCEYFASHISRHRVWIILFSQRSRTETGIGGARREMGEGGENRIARTRNKI